MGFKEESLQEKSSDNDELFIVYDVNAMCRSEISVPLMIENNDYHMQLDTGCALSPSPLTFLKQFCPEAEVKPTR